MVYLDGEDILRLHKIVIDFSGGSHGIRDAHLLASILAKPKMTFGGQELYPSVWDKAATYYEGLAKFHVFVDGNKRTALASTTRFLRMNGYKLKAVNKEADHFTMDIIAKKLDQRTIAAWLKKHSRKVRS